MFNKKTSTPIDTGTQRERHCPAFLRTIYSAASVPRLIFAFVIFISLAVSGCSLLPSSGKPAQNKDGVITAEGITVDFGDNAVGSDTQTTLIMLEPDTEETPDGLASDLYELKMETVYDAPVTVTLKFDGERPADVEDAVLMLGLGSTFEMDDGSVETLFRYIPVQQSDGNVSASFIPSDYAELSLHGNSNTGTSAPNKEQIRLGVVWVTSTYTDGGHFIVYMPYSRKLMLSEAERRLLLDDLEKVFNDYLGKGYSYSKRDHWPMDVTITKMDELGYYSYAGNGAAGSLYLRREHFDKGYKSGSLNSLLAHEFFHFVQLNYVNPGSDLLWFDEATATYFESVMANTVPTIVNQYQDLPFTGVYPQQNTAANGYARMPLIKFLAKLRGEEFILNAYTIAGEGADWDSTLLSSVGPPTVWAADYYVELLAGKISDLVPYAVHGNLIAGKPEVNGFGTYVKLVLPTPEELAAKPGEPATLGQATVHVGALGAQLVALTIDPDVLKGLQDGVDPVVKVSGGDLRVLKILNRNVQALKSSGGGVTLQDFKKAISGKYLYLAIVTNLTENAQDIVLTVESAVFPTLDEVVGTYDGAVTVTTAYISDALKQEAASAGSAGTATGSADELGCDLTPDIIGQIEALVGQEKAGKIILAKTGDNTGTLIAVIEGDDGMGDQPSPFTYNKGILTINITQDSVVTKGELTAAYGKDKTIIINGTLTFTLIPNHLWITVRVTGSKPIVTP